MAGVFTWINSTMIEIMSGLQNKKNALTKQINVCVALET